MGAERYVALLRAVNVAGQGKLSMSELRSAFEAGGWDDVETYIQSGNVVFTGAPGLEPAAIEAAIASAFGAPVEVVLRTPAQLRRLVDTNPFLGPGSEPRQLHVAFTVGRPTPAAVEQIPHDELAPDRVAPGGDDLFLFLPAGVGRSKTPRLLARSLGVALTLRNWNTVTTLADLAEG